jgi:hypothetical protein
VAITESERIRLARALCDLQFDGTDEDQRKIDTVIGHLADDDGRAVCAEWKAMFTAEHEKMQEFFKQRKALFNEYPPGTTWGEIMRSLPPDRRKAIESRGKGFRLVRTGKGR